MGRENDEKDQANILTPAEEKKGTGSADSGSSNTAGGAAVIEVYYDAPKASMKIVAARALFTVAKGDASNTSVKSVLLRQFQREAGLEDPVKVCA